MLSTVMVKGDELGWVLRDWFGGLNTGRWLPQAQQSSEKQQNNNESDRNEWI